MAQKKAGGRWPKWLAFTAGPHHGNGAGGGQRPEGPGHRGVRSRPALLQGTRPEGKSSLCSLEALARYRGFHLVLSSGGEGPVVHRPGGGGHQMGDHRPGCVATTCQTVHERGCVPGRVKRFYLPPLLHKKEKVSIPNVFFLHSKPLPALIGACMLPAGDDVIASEQ